MADQQPNPASVLATRPAPADTGDALRELEALGGVVNALLGLPPESRERVLGLAERFFARPRPSITRG